MSAATLSPLDPAVIGKAVDDVEFYVQIHATTSGSERRAFETAVDQAYAERRPARTGARRSVKR